jgi:hypothetical protein
MLQVVLHITMQQSLFALGYIDTNPINIDFASTTPIRIDVKRRSAYERSRTESFNVKNLFQCCAAMRWPISHSVHI